MDLLEKLVPDNAPKSAAPPLSHNDFDYIRYVPIILVIFSMSVYSCIVWTAPVLIVLSCD